MAKRLKKEMKVIGWREWLKIPDLGIENIKVKVDTGARSSSLHACKVEVFERGDEKWVRFKVNPSQKKGKAVEVEAKILEFRSVKSSNGIVSKRPVIVSNVTLHGITWPIEITLAQRSEMGFKMLLGRQAFRKKFLVNAGKSYMSCKPE
jgi:hypothetical protein